MKLLACTVLAVVACSGGNKNPQPPDRSSPTTGTGEGQPCTQEVALVCPDGQIDACEKALAADDTPDAGDTGTMMAVDQGRMGRLERAGNHRCVAR
jgi:hypothetical protein